MKLLAMSVLVTLCACGLPLPKDSAPTPGVYDITSTATRLTPNPSSTTCGTLDTTPHHTVVEIVKENGQWIMYGCNDQGVRQVQLATYSSGTFTAHGCAGIWCEDMTFDLTFDTLNGVTTVDGTSTVVLTAPGYPGTCTEDNDITGTKR